MKLKDPLLLRQLCFIDGGWAPADDGGTLSVSNPATSEKLGLIPNMGAAECRRAISSAAAALPAWADDVADCRNHSVSSCRRLAEQGVVFAQYNLGAMYDGGKGVPLDYDEAARWLRLRIECAPAQFPTSSQRL